MLTIHPVTAPERQSSASHGPGNMSLSSATRGLGLARGLWALCSKSGLSAEATRTIHTTTPVAGIKMTDFHLRKITQDFDHIYDADRDGFIDSTDIEDFKRRLRKYMEMVKGKAMKDSYKAGFDDYWSIMLEEADTNKDGFISREEWIHIWDSIIKKAEDLSPSSLPQWVRMMPHSLFPVIDVKGDGVIDREEYRDFWHHVGGYRLVTDEELQRYFAHMTENGTKPLDQARLEELFADFYLSGDAETPGRYVCGPIRYRFDMPEPK